MYCTNMQSCVSSTHGGRASCRIAQCVASYGPALELCVSLSQALSVSGHKPRVASHTLSSDHSVDARCLKAHFVRINSMIVHWHDRGDREEPARSMSDLTIYSRPESEMIATVRSDCATRYWRRLPALCVVLLARGVATSCAHCSVPRWPSAARCPSRRPRSARRPMRSPRRLESRT